MVCSPSAVSALDRARAKAYLRLLPLLFVCYAIAYVDRVNVSLAALKMSKDLIAFDNAVVGFGSGVFFIGYFLLEIPGTLLVEKWSARKWISRIMVTWGVMAAATAFVTTPFQFYVVRFLLGLAEAGFFPGVIVYLTHWFPARDRGRALSWFFIATPIAQFVSPRLSYFLLRIGTTETIGLKTVHHALVWGMHGWQWMYIAWGIPAVVLGMIVLRYLPDWPKDARWLEPNERDSLDRELKSERSLHEQPRHKGLRDSLVNAFQHPKVLLLAAAYFFVVTSSYGVEIFLPKILEKWYELGLNEVTWAVIIPPLGGLAGQLFIGWSSDRTGERRLHGSMPIYIGAVALAGTLLIPALLPSQIRLISAVLLFTVALMGLKAYMPAFWALPNLFLTEAAAAGSIGLINSIGNLGGFVGPYVVGRTEKWTHSFAPGIWFLCISMIVSASIILTLGLGHRANRRPQSSRDPVDRLPVETPDAKLEHIASKAPR
jgi:ACS family tartrate transporter-like MFS transporter